MQTSITLCVRARVRFVWSVSNALMNVGGGWVLKVVVVFDFHVHTCLDVILGMYVCVYVFTLDNGTWDNLANIDGYRVPT